MPARKRTIKEEVQLDDYFDLKHYDPSVKSTNHQFRSYYNETIATPFKRLYKTRLYMIGFQRIDPQNKRNWIGGLLKTPIDQTTYRDEYEREVHHTELPWRYEDEVIELYSEADYRSFYARNKGFIDNGTLKEYNDEQFVYRIQYGTSEDGEAFKYYMPVIVHSPVLPSRPY